MARKQTPNEIFREAFKQGKITAAQFVKYTKFGGRK